MGYLGVRFSGAHYDIYANDGTVQPGCKLSDPRCSHNRAISIFAESINSKEKFIAQKCDSKDAWLSSKDCEGNHELKIEVGEHCTPPKNDTEIGIYQFLTNEIKPYVKALPGI
ncbi:lipoprotein lipase-like [Planococcus citri]|uniref:lipoprotein lipase-like n=1 Tax=Planococcus citri TaxID=170843 RepID=UPI0031F8978D